MCGNNFFFFSATRSLPLFFPLAWLKNSFPEMNELNLPIGALFQAAMDPESKELQLQKIGPRGFLR
jgi:hypothetical protein